VLNKELAKFLTPYPLYFGNLARIQKTYPNNITPLVRPLGVNGKDAALSES